MLQLEKNTNQQSIYIKISKILFYIICFLPLLFYVFLQYKFGRNVPFWDDWEIVDLYRQWIANNSLTFSDLWAPHNEHRILVANLLILALGKWTHFNTLIPMYLATALKLPTLFLIWKLIKFTLKRFDKIQVYYVFFLVCISIFSIHDGELLIWGISSLYFNVFLFFQILLMFILTTKMNTWLGMVTASICVIVCSLIISNGLILIFTCSLQIFLYYFLNGKRLLNWKTIFWTLVMSVFIIIYFYDYPYSNFQNGNEKITWLFSNLGPVLQFYFTYLASMMKFNPGELALFVGITGLVAYLLLTYYFIRYHIDWFKELLPWFLFGLNVIIGAGLTTFGRVQFGIGVANSSRYIFFSRFFWLGLFVIIVVALNQYLKNRISINKIRIGTLIILIILFIFPIMNSNIEAYTALKPHWSRWSVGLNYLYHYETSPDKYLELLYPNVPRLKELTRFMVNYKLGPFN